MVSAAPWPADGSHGRRGCEGAVLSLTEDSVCAGMARVSAVTLPVYVPASARACAGAARACWPLTEPRHPASQRHVSQAASGGLLTPGETATWRI